MHTFETDQNRPNHPIIKSSFIFFVIIIFFYALGDSVMSFMAPNLVDNIVNNSFYMGLIISSSSVIGFITDYSLSNLIKERSFYTYALIGVVIAMFFPVILLIKTSVVLAVLSMAIWGIYFELLLFAKSNYIHHFLHHDQHDVGWVFLNAFSSLAYIIGPTFALYVISEGQKIPLYLALAIQFITLLGLIIFKLVFARQTRNPTCDENHQPSFLQGFKSWKILNRKLYPVLTYLFLLNVIDAMFWTTGAVLANSLRGSHRAADYFYVIYLLPAFIIAPIGIKFGKYFGKKRTAYTAGALAGIAFGTSLFTNDFSTFMIHIGIGSVFFAIANPEIRGTLEDYCERLGHNANTLVGLSSSTSSLGFIIGPILAGAISYFLGEQKTFGVIGYMLAFASILLLLITPRKIRLPINEVKQNYS